ncbi:MAG: M15 family metallopeptidase [Bacteroidia bacterium]|nr:M15 family metallopeptidase [Bacteroidia bacterium]
MSRGVLALILAAGLAAAVRASSGRRPDRLPLWDSVSERRLAGLHPEVAAAAAGFIQDAYRRGIRLRIAEGWRSYSRQQDLYAKGRTTPGPAVTSARPGESFHNFGLAVDVVEMSPGLDRALGYSSSYPASRWEEIGVLGEQHGFEWGGRWTRPDRPHFQMKLGRPAAAWRTDYEAGRLDYMPPAGYIGAMGTLVDGRRRIAGSYIGDGNNSQEHQRVIRNIVRNWGRLLDFDPLPETPVPAVRGKIGRKIPDVVFFRTVGQTPAVAVEICENAAALERDLAKASELISAHPGIEEVFCYDLQGRVWHRVSRTGAALESWSDTLQADLEQLR